MNPFPNPPKINSMIKGKIESVKAVNRLRIREETLISLSHCSGATLFSSGRSESDCFRNR